MAAPSSFRRSYADVQEAREHYEELQAAKRARAKRRRAKAKQLAATRRKTGKVTHVRAYCRRAAAKFRSGGEMPF